jgi:carbonic anhydrase/acetyltransferase-like protein (isoleucine patch superfamily)
MLQAYILKKDSIIDILDKELHQLTFGNVSLHEYQNEVFKNVGCQRVHTVTGQDIVRGPAMIVADDVFISRRALKSFKKVVKTNQSCRLVLPSSRQTQLLSPLQDVPETQEGLNYEVFFIPEGVEGQISELTRPEVCEPTPIPYREILLPQRVPQFILGTPQANITVPLTSTVVMHVRHWLHVLRLAHLWPQISLIEKAQSTWWRTLWHLAWGFSFNAQQKIANYYDRFCFIQRGGFIHPTATIEASVVGKNVRIGAYANVVGSVLGDHVVIEDRANVNYSVLGRDTFVSKNSTVVACVAFGPTDVCVNGIQYSVIDQECGLTSWAKPLDASPHGPVRVMDRDTLREVGELPCGVAFGKKCYVGADVVIAPGRVVSPGQTLTLNKEDLIS